jgi:small-conductance mechanosensitive channel
MFIRDALFVLGLIYVVIVFLKLVNFAATRYRKYVEPEEHKDDHHLDPEIALVQHASYLLVISAGILLGLVYFGVDINIFATFVLIVGLGIAVGARALVSDLVAGFIILAGQPFRVGDGIKLQGWQEYGLVEAIGTRAIQVRTIDNRAVVVRNSTAINNELVNYSLPDTTVMIQTDIRITYRADLDEIRRVITDTVRGVKGVLPDKPVDILYREFGNSTRRIRVRWWIADFDDEYFIVDDVNSAIDAALTEAGFQIPFTTLDLNLIRSGESQTDDS